MKKLLKSTLSLFMAFTLVLGTAYAGLGRIDFDGLFTVRTHAASVDDLTFSIGDDGTYYVLYECNPKASGALTIPAKYKGLPVKVIGSAAFNECVNITSVKIPDSVTDIEDYAFYRCTGITTVTFGSGLKTIGDCAFFNCENLNAVSFPDGLTHIGVSAFEGCGKLKTLSIPGSVKTIGGLAFVSCSNVASLTLGYGIKTIEYGAFSGFRKITTVKIPNSVTTLGNSVFSGCSKLEKVTMSNKATSIPQFAFSECANLSAIVIPDSATRIGKYAFSNCTNLSSVTIGSGVKSIGEYAFLNCSKFTSVKIPYGVTRLYKGAFSDCSGITSITIPNTVKIIGEDAFNNCTGLKTIKIGSGVTTIGDNAFFEVHNTKSVYITDLAKWCGISFGTNESNPLYYANNLYVKGELVKNVTIPSGVKKIPRYGLSCNNIVSVKIPDSVTAIHEGAFYRSANLRTVTMGSGVKTIGNDAFYYCGNLKTVTMSSYITKIGSGAFYWCDSLQAITIPAGVKKISSYAFYWCKSLSSVRIRKGVETIGDGAFFGCESLKYVAIPESVTKINSQSLGYASGKVAGFTIRGKSGSAAEKYAKNNGFKFVSAKCSHSKTEWIVDKKATVYAAGEKHKECVSCGEILKRATIKQLTCSAVKLTKVANITTGVKVYWSKTTGADSYRIYRKIKDGSWKAIGNTKELNYIDKTAQGGTMYYYCVRAINEAGLGATCKTTKSIKFLDNPVLSAPVSYANGVELKWSKTVGAGGYEIYRKSGDGQWEIIGTNKGVSNLSYTDTSAQKEVAYSYKVRAYYGETYSAYSGAKTITHSF